MFHVVTQLKTWQLFYNAHPCACADLHNPTFYAFSMKFHVFLAELNHYVYI